MARAKATSTSLGSILVVEDDPILAMNLEDVLREEGAEQVAVCQSTQRAFEALEEEKFDAIVLDVHLADRDDGWSVAELVCELTVRPPVIVFATGSPDDIPEDVAELGIVLAKPYDARALASEIRRQQDAGGIFAKLKSAIGRR